MSISKSALSCGLLSPIDLTVLFPVSKSKILRMNNMPNSRLQKEKKRKKGEIRFGTIYLCDLRLVQPSSCNNIAQS